MTSGHAVAERPRDASCLSVVSFNSAVFYLPPTKEDVHVFASVCLFVCLFVCLSVSNITQKRVHGFG